MNDVNYKAEFARLEQAALMLHRRLVEVEKRANAYERAILDLAAALRRSGVIGDESWALSLHSAPTDPDRQSADEPSTLST